MAPYFLCTSCISGCDRNSITQENLCPAIGQKGNNANQNGSSTPAIVLDGNTNHTDNERSFQPNNKAGIDFLTTEKPLADERVEHKSMDVTLGVFVPISLVLCALLWILYAYRNPHTRSGQLLIQVSHCTF